MSTWILWFAGETTRPGTGLGPVGPGHCSSVLRNFSREVRKKQKSLQYDGKLCGTNIVSLIILLEDFSSSGQRSCELLSYPRVVVICNLAVDRKKNNLVIAKYHFVRYTMYARTFI